MNVVKDPDVSEKQRATWVDQARWLAIVLVVIGHAVGLMRPYSGLAVFFSNFVYIFHIPVFVLLAGWAAQRTEASAKNLAKIWWQLLLPYIIFQTIAFVLAWLVRDKQPSWVYTDQTFGLWFLVALAAWRIMIPWFRGSRWSVAIALGISLASGMSPHIGGWFSIARILCFLPLFVLGPWLVQRISHWRTIPLIRYSAMLYLAGLCFVVARAGRDFWRLPFLGTSSYEELGVSDLQGIAVRLGVLCLAVVTSTAFLLALPGKPGAPSSVGQWVATAGQHTMYPYLIHLQVRTLVDSTSLAEAGNPAATTCLFIAAAIAICVVLEFPVVRRFFSPFVEPKSFFHEALPRRQRSSR